MEQPGVRLQQGLLQPALPERRVCESTERGVRRCLVHRSHRPRLSSLLMKRESEKPEQEARGTLCRFADNTKLDGVIGVPRTRASIQQDLGKLEANYLMKFSRDM